MVHPAKWMKKSEKGASHMFGIMSSVIKTASREDVWSHRQFTPEDNAMMAEVERRAGGARGRWRSYTLGRGKK
jgi:hypothetical protein